LYTILVHLKNTENDGQLDVQYFWTEKPILAVITNQCISGI